MNIVLRILLCGVYDPDSILFALNGTPHIVKAIWLMLKKLYISHIRLPYRDLNVSTEYIEYVGRFLGNNVLNDDKFLKKIPEGILSELWSWDTKDLNISFPPPTDIKINMMPYIFGGEKFKSYKLPSYLKPYFQIIKHCYGSRHDINKVFYLTIHESEVEPGKSQRCPGVHIDNSGPLKINTEEDYVEGEGIGSTIYIWSNGEFKNECISGGIFIASNVPNSCRLWDCQIEKDFTNGSEITGENGECEHMREFLPADKELVLEKNKLYWITERTPHESLPLQNGTYRQFIRVVTANVSHWFADHSTPSPCGVQPDPNITKIVIGNKFVKNSLEIIEHKKYFENDLKHDSENDKKSFLSRLKSKMSR